MDRDDHRPAHRDPGGDQAMSTTTPRWPRWSARWPTTRRRWAAATPSGPCRAPTLESAVAAAAMAQDELGHARSTYPVLKALGVERRRRRLRRRPPARAARRRAARLDRVHRRQPAGRRRADDVRRRLRRQLASTPMAQRAKKILQEEGSHRVHGEAWAQRLCRAGRSATRCVARLRETWAQAGALARARRRPGLRARRSTAGDGHARPRRTSASWCASWLDRAARRARASRSRSPSRPTGRLGPRAAPVDAMTCPFCDVAGRRARRPVGRPDHHRASGAAAAATPTSRPCARTMPRRA